jgi:hypothetical protein
MGATSFVTDPLVPALGFVGSRAVSLQTVNGCIGLHLLRISATRIVQLHVIVQKGGFESLSLRHIIYFQLLANNRAFPLSCGTHLALTPYKLLDG